MNRKERRALAKQTQQRIPPIPDRLRSIAKKARAQGDGHPERSFQLFAMEVKRVSLSDPSILDDVALALWDKVKRDRPDLTDDEVAEEATRRLQNQPSVGIKKGHA